MEAKTANYVPGTPYDSSVRPYCTVNINGDRRATTAGRIVVLILYSILHEHVHSHTPVLLPLAVVRQSKKKNYEYRYSYCLCSNSKYKFVPKNVGEERG